MEELITSIKALDAFTGKFFSTFPPREDGATIIGLSGDLGSGKTTFAGAAARVLNVSDAILSPTFVVAKFYAIPEHPSWSRFVHVDAYRIEDPLELRSLRWSELIADPRNLILVEWPERAGAFFPHNARILTFRFVDETTRAILS